MMLKKNNKSVYYLLSFFLPLLAIIAIYATVSVAPFLKNSILTYDMNSQYTSFFAAMRKAIYGDASLIYSWSRTLGGEFSGIFCYYLASPLSWIVALFPEQHLTTAIYCIVIMKFALSGFTMSWFLNYKNNYQYSKKTIAFGLCYALSAYMVTYAFNTMWIDSVIWLPVLMYLIERLIDKTTWKLYTAILAVIVISNFYTGFMCCIFSALYFLCYYFAVPRAVQAMQKTDRAKKFWKSFAVFIGSSFISICISMIVLVPIYHAMSFGKIGVQDGLISWLPSFKCNPLDIFANSFPASYNLLDAKGTPLVYCGIPTVLLSILFFFNKNVSKREKWCYGILLGIMMLSMMITTFDQIWHCFAVPFCMNYRYSFMYCFVLILIAYRTFIQYNGISKKSLLIATCITISMLITGCLWKARTVSNFVLISLIISATFCIIYVLLLFAQQKNKKSTFMSALSVILCIELFVSGAFAQSFLNAQSPYKSNSEYQNYYQKYNQIVQEIYAKDNSFYRLEKTSLRCLGDNMEMNIHGLANSTSTLHTQSISFLEHLGYFAIQHHGQYTGGTELSDSLLGIKYIIADTEITRPGYELTAQYPEKGVYVYQNTHALSIATAMPKDVLSLEYTEQDVPLTYLNRLSSACTSIQSELFTEADVQYQGLSHEYVFNADGDSGYGTATVLTYVTYTFTANQEQENCELYLYIPYDFYGTDFGGTGWDISPAPSTNAALQPIRKLQAGQTYTLRILLNNSDKMYIKTSEYEHYQTTHAYTFKPEEDSVYADVQCATLNESAYLRTIYELSQYTMDISEYGDTFINGTVTADANHDVLVTTIPYDPSWHATIDGNRVTTNKTTEGMLYIPVTAGTHAVAFTYVPDSVYTGCGLCCFGLVIFACSCVVSVYRKKRRNIQTQDLKSV